MFSEIFFRKPAKTRSFLRNLDAINSATQTFFDVTQSGKRSFVEGMGSVSGALNSLAGQFQEVERCLEGFVVTVLQSTSDISAGFEDAGLSVSNTLNNLVQQFKKAEQCLAGFTDAVAQNTNDISSKFEDASLSVSQALEGLFKQFQEAERCLEGFSISVSQNVNSITSSFESIDLSNTLIQQFTFTNIEKNMLRFRDAVTQMTDCISSNLNSVDFSSNLVMGFKTIESNSLNVTNAFEGIRIEFDNLVEQFNLFNLDNLIGEFNLFSTDSIIGEFNLFRVELGRFSERLEGVTFNFNGLRDSVSEATSPFDVIRNAIGLLSDIFDFLGIDILSLINLFTEGFGIKGTIVRVISEIIGPITSSFGEIDGVIERFVVGIAENISIFMNNITESFNNLQNSVTEGWDSFWGNIQDFSQSGAGGVMGTVNRMIQSVREGVNSLIGAFNSIGFDMPPWLGGGSFRPSIPKIPPIQIPMLARGGIVVHHHI